MSVSDDLISPLGGFYDENSKWLRLSEYVNPINLNAVFSKYYIELVLKYKVLLIPYNDIINEKI